MAEMHSLHAPYVDVYEDRFRFGAPSFHNMHQQFEATWVPIDPVLYHVQFEQQQKQLNYISLPQQYPLYQPSTSHVSETSSPIGMAHDWNGPVNPFRRSGFESANTQYASFSYESPKGFGQQHLEIGRHVSHDSARCFSPPTETHYSQPSWTPGSSFVMTPTSTPTSGQTPSIALRELDLQESQEYHFDLQEEDLRAQLPVNAPEELELSEGIVTFAQTSRMNEALPTRAQYDTDSSMSPPIRDHDSDSDFDPKKKGSRSAAHLRPSNQRHIRRTSSSSYTTIDSHNRIHKQTPQVTSNKEKSRRKSLPQLNSQSAASSNSRLPKSFPCSFHIFGCTATFANKNEWKRHVTSQHLQLGFYRCDLGTCNPENNMQSTSNSAQSPPVGKSRRTLSKYQSTSTSPSHLSYRNTDEQSDDEVVTYNDFNRKDLFTQHCRRMHGPARHLTDNTTQTNQNINARLRAQGRRIGGGRNIGKPMSNKEDDAAFEEELELIRARCWTPRRYAPARTSCGFCGRLFEADAHVGHSQDLDGKNAERAWEERMEHLGKHYERDGCSPSLESIDQDLLDWGLKEGILVQIENDRAWLVGYDLQTSKDSQPSPEMEEAVRREGLRRRGPRRKATNLPTTQEVEGNNDAFVKSESVISTIFKSEETDEK